MSDWSSFVGRTQSQNDSLTAALVRRHRATLDHDPADARPLPGIHWCLNLPDAATADLGADGHPRRDVAASFLPAIDLPRRMWAASEVDFLAPIPVGATVERISTIRSITEKTGTTGRLAFVTLDHAVSADGVVAVNEVQTLVYREAVQKSPSPSGEAVQKSPSPSGEGLGWGLSNDAALTGQTPPPTPPLKGRGEAAAVPPLKGMGLAVAPHPEEWPHHRALTPSETLLFRFSALTFNSHRIHYDAPYAREAEGYAGLVVHGPLSATLLLLFATDLFGPIRRFTFRAAAPAFAGEVMTLVARDAPDGIALAALGPAGAACITATAIAR